MEKERARVKIIAGPGAVIETRIPILYLHVTLQPGAKFEHEVPKDFSLFTYVFDGAGSGEMRIYGDDGDGIAFQNDSTAKQEILVLGGRPIREPVARYGPFVMNTVQEIEEAFDDYRSGKMGRIA